MRGTATVAITFAIAIAAGPGTAAAGSAQLRCNAREARQQAERAPILANPHVPTFTATIYDYAGVGEKNVTDAEQIVDAIYRKAGVAIRWLNACDVNQPIGLAVNLVPTSTAHGVMGEDALGFADYQSVTANVLYDRVITAASVTKFRPVPVIGCVMAHELGHLLLGPGSHSATGIMRAGFNPRTACWSASFSREQAARVAHSIGSFAGIAATDPRETSDFQSVPKDSPVTRLE